MQEMTVDEVGQVGGGLICGWAAWMTDVRDAISQVGATFDAAVGAVVDVACRISGDC